MASGSKETIPVAITVAVLILVLTFVSQICSASYQPTSIEHISTDSFSDTVNVSLLIEITIYDVDYSVRNAKLFIYMGIFGFPYQNASTLTVFVEGAHAPSVSIECDWGGNGTYWGKVSDITWPLEGFGEMYPFDSYNMSLYVSRGFYYGVENIWARFAYMNAKLDNRSYVRFDGQDLRFDYCPKYGPYWFFLSGISRDSTIPFYQLLLPILLSYLLAGGSTLIPRSKIGTRLRVYVALFVFAPMFLFTIQSYLPYRLSLCIPEILLVNVIISTVIFAFVGMIPCKSQVASIILDVFPIGMSAFLFYFLQRSSSVEGFEPPFSITVLIPTVALASGMIIHTLFRVFQDRRKKKDCSRNQILFE